MKSRSSGNLLLVFLVVFLAVMVRLVFWGEIKAFIHRDYVEVPVVSGSNWFDYPVGAPNAKGYYSAQKFGGESSHLGEDWNGIGGGNSDYGDAVYSVADGTVSFAEDVKLGWGNVVRIVHPVNGNDPVEAVYAHFAKIKVHKGEKVKRGQVIGTIGDAGGIYLAHLHFEIRREVGLPLGGGYGSNDEGLFYDPSNFIAHHRKR